MNEYKFYNTFNKEIEMLPIARFLFYYPDYGIHLAQVVEFWAKDASQISITRIQRKYMIRYVVADTMLEALLLSGIAVRLHDPVRVEVCLEEAEAKRLSRFIINSVQDIQNCENRLLFQEAINSAFKLYSTPIVVIDNLDSDDLCINNGHLCYYGGKDEDLVIPEGVTHIRRFGFFNNKILKSVVFPTGMVAIGEDAFRGCKNLENVVFSQTIKQIGSGAFMDCERLEEIVLPNSVERVCTNVFSGCSNVKEIRISENLYSIPMHMFFGCKKVETVHIPDYVSEIDSRAFGKCDALKIAYVPKHTEISCDAFPEHTEIIRI